jgi:biopolymer transport protein ExbD
MLEDSADGLKRRLGNLHHANSTDWERQLQSRGLAELEQAERGLGFLATVSSASPFIGLLGTVWGVMVAFLRIGSQSGQAMLEVVGPGIAEALIATVAGLATAIPATIAYNYFSAVSGQLRRRLEELAGQVEGLSRSRPRGSQPMKLPAGRAPLSEINVTPLVDVFLVLLVIFMITAPVLRHAFELALPTAATTPTATSEGLTVRLDADGRLRVEDSPLGRAELGAFLKDWSANLQEPQTVYIEADAGIAYGEVVGLLDEIRSAGISDVGIVTRPGARETAGQP